MKQKIAAIVIFVFILVFTTINTVVLQKMTDSITEKVEILSFADENAGRKAQELYEEFKANKGYIALTVSHDDITNIEDCFAELNGCLAVGDTKGATVAKYRLISFLGHLRRLVGFNIDTII